MAAWRTIGFTKKNEELTADDDAKLDAFVNKIMGKCTSGVHTGTFIHELLHLVWTNITDIFGVKPCMHFFQKIVKN